MRSLVVLTAVLAVSIAAPQNPDWFAGENVDNQGTIQSSSAYGQNGEILEDPRYSYVMPLDKYGGESEGESYSNQDDAQPSSYHVVEDGQDDQEYQGEYSKKKRSIWYSAVVPNSPVVYKSAVYFQPELRAVYAAPATTVYTAPVALPSAVTHQSRVDVNTSPAVVAVQPAAVAAPAVEVKSVPVVAPSPSYTVYAGGSAVSQQSRVDVKSSPAIVTEQVVQPAVVAPTVIQSSPAVIETGPAVVDARSVYYTPFTAYAHQPLVDVQTPTYYAQEVVSPFFLKKKRSSS